jgi:hypothetical protein
VFSAQAQLSNYSQDFESLDRTDPGALSSDGWLFFAADVDGVPGDPLYGPFTFGPIGAPNNTASPNTSLISNIDFGGNPPAGLQGLLFFSDYNSGIHSDPNDPRGLLLSVFQQQVIGADDIGKTAVFDFLAQGNPNPPSGSASAEAFLLTLDSNFNATNLLFFDTTSVVSGSPTAGQLSLDLTDPLLEGQILQFGFRNTARDGEGSAVDYDNINFQVVPEPSSLALVGIGAAAVLIRRRRR